MNNDDDNLLADHSYDGIHELDNPLPDWWLFTFLATIMFSFFYFVHYEIAGGQSIADELKSDLAAVEAQKKTNPAPMDSEEDLSRLLASAAAREEGKGVYAGKCAACHGPELQGSIGPNLTDDFWINGKGGLGEIASVIRKGVAAKGMPPWDGLLTDSEIKAVTVYVAHQHGSNPPNPKPPQGEKIVRN